MSIWTTALNTALALAYPLLIWWGLDRQSPRSLGIAIVALLLPTVALRFHTSPKERLWAVLRIPLAVIATAGLSIASDDPRFLLAMPVLINLVLLAFFAGSLRRGPTAVENFARLKHPELSPQKIAHCRQATLAWSIFFALNASTAAALALFAPLAWWASYNGGIAYALMALIFAGEFLVRKKRFREFGPSLQDRIASRLFSHHAGGSGDL